MAYLIPLLACLIPFSWLLVCDHGLDPKEQYRRFFAWFLVMTGLASVATVLAGVYVLGVVESPRWSKFAYCGVMVTFWVACDFKNKREFRKLFGGKPKAPPDELA